MHGRLRDNLHRSGNIAGMSANLPKCQPLHHYKCGGRDNQSGKSRCESEAEK